MTAKCLAPAALFALACTTLANAASAGPNSLAQPSGDFEILEVTTGFGPLLPHRIFQVDGLGNPTNQIVEIRELDDLIANSTTNNAVLPTATWPSSAVLPTGQPGNQFVLVSFTQALDIGSILDASPSAAANGQLTGAILVKSIDPVTGQVTQVPGRAFVGGKTYAGLASGNPPALPLQEWIQSSPAGLVANPAIDNNADSVPDGLGIPGTEAGTQPYGADFLLRPNVFLFIPDSDGLLTSHETMPSGRSIVVEISTAVRSTLGESLCQAGRVTSSIGVSNTTPEVRFHLQGGASAPDIVPTNGSLDVDPTTDVTVGFTESLQLRSLGTIGGTGAAGPSSAISLSFGAGSQVTVVPFSVLPVSVFDFSTVVLTPAFPFPGESSTGLPSGAPLNQIDISVNAGQVANLSGSLNQLSAQSFFRTGEGPGLINAPVAPDAIYAGIRGTTNALSVIDLNGFGQGTGNPNWNSATPAVEGNSNFPNNPNVQFQGSNLRPPLTVGTSTTDGGSSGVFTRTRDSNLDANLAKSPVLLDTSDMALGRSLDTSFNNGPAPFGCQAGGGNLCALDGLMNIKVTMGTTPATTAPAGPNDPLLHQGVGMGNTIAWAPHPNPPPLTFPPLCVTPFIGGQEPTSVASILPPPKGLGLVNLLVPGDPFGNPSQNVPPSGLLSLEQNAFFQGPNSPQPNIAACLPFMMRQQVGQFLYVVDRVRREVVVLNSNRMTPIDRIPLRDPARIAVSPNLDYIAVTNQRTDTVSFISIDPSDASFHQVVKQTNVGNSPLGIAWDSFNEDLLVCNEADNSVSVISAFSLAVRKVVSMPSLSMPFDVVITPRQTVFGSRRNVYYGYVLSRDGRVSVFESGPGGVNGWGYDDFIGQARYLFRQPKDLAVDVLDLNSAVWVAHEGAIDLNTGLSAPAGTGALTRLFAQTNTQGSIPLVPNSAPQFRQLRIKADVSLGSSVLTGIPTDLAMDNLRNLGSLPNVGSPFSAGSHIQFNGKSLVRDVTGIPLPASHPSFLFAAIPVSSQGSGAVDVIDLANLSRKDTNAFQPGTQSVEMPGVTVLADYFQQ